MAKHNYGYQKTEDNTAKAVGRNLDVSPKQGTEICKYIRGKSVARAKRILEDAIAEKIAIPFTRFTNGLGHKPGMSAGRYNPKACAQILKVLKSAEANAKNKGYNSNDLKVVHSSMQIGTKNHHYGRKRRSIFKNSNIEIVVQEVKGLADTKKTTKKVVAAPKKKAEAKPAHSEHSHSNAEHKHDHEHKNHEHHDHKHVKKD